MTLYYVNVEATSNASTGTTDTFIALQPVTNAIVKVRRVRVSVPGVPPSTEVSLRVQVTRKQAMGTGGVSSGAIPIRSTALSADTTIVIKSGATVFGAGSSLATLIQVAMNQRATYEWIPRDDNEALESGQSGIAPSTGGILGLDISSSGQSTLVRAELEFEE